MLVAFTFRAKPGKEAELERILSDPEAGRRVAEKLGASRNTLFLGGGRMVRVLEFPPDATPRPLGDVAREDPAVADFLRRLGPLVEDGFDLDDPESLRAFNERAALRLAYDVHVATVQPSRAEL